MGNEIFVKTKDKRDHSAICWAEFCKKNLGSLRNLMGYVCSAIHFWQVKTKQGTALIFMSAPKVDIFLSGP